jgi:hypothetical protein
MIGINPPGAHRSATGTFPNVRRFPFGVQKENPMNTIVYIVGLVVIIGAVLAFLGLR